jgi:hypothetical protein
MTQIEDLKLTSPDLRSMCIRFLEKTQYYWFEYFGVEKLDKKLNLMSIENCMCEIDK